MDKIKLNKYHCYEKLYFKTIFFVMNDHTSSINFTIITQDRCLLASCLRVFLLRLLLMMATEEDMYITSGLFYKCVDPKTKLVQFHTSN